MEYTRYGDGFVRRLDEDHDWEPVDDVPEDVLVELEAVAQRKAAAADGRSGGVTAS